MRAGFFKVTVLSLLALSNTENGITCREGHGDAAYGTTPGKPYESSPDPPRSVGRAGVRD